MSSNVQRNPSLYCASTKSLDFMPLYTVCPARLRRGEVFQHASIFVSTLEIVLSLLLSMEWDQHRRFCAVIDENTTVAPCTQDNQSCQSQIAESAGIRCVISASSRLDFPSLADGRCRYGPTISWHCSSLLVLKAWLDGTCIKTSFLPSMWSYLASLCYPHPSRFLALSSAFSREEAQGYSIS